MRNVFDQYEQPENRATHALMTAINEDRALLGLFLRELVNVKPPSELKSLGVLEQQLPGEHESDEGESERRGVPDGWVFDDDGWCVLIETKVTAALDGDQIRRHLNTAKKRGFRDVTAVAIAPHRLSRCPPNIVMIEWRTIYAWLRRHGDRSMWAARAADYLEILEVKLIEKERFVEGTLTMFTGFPFGHEHPFTYLEGRRVLKLAMSELRGHQDLRERLQIDPNAPGRSAIKGTREDAVWDYLLLSPTDGGSSVTTHTHLTLNVRSRAVEAMVTIPNGVNTGLRRRVDELGERGFQGIVGEVVANLSPLTTKHEGVTPWFRGVQRHYRSRSGPPSIDASIDFDLRTAIKTDGMTKLQPRWLSAAYNSFIDKNGSNYQIQIGAVFHYDQCSRLRQPDAIGLIAEAWLGCRPLVALAR